MSLITQHSLILNDPVLLASLILTIAFAILAAACLIAAHLGDKALRKTLDEALADIPEAQRKDLVAMAIRVSKGQEL